MPPLNLKLKDGVDPSALLKFGFVPKYDEDTGEIKEYVKKIYIGDKNKENHFTFFLYTETSTTGIIFRRHFYYIAWMTGFHWNDLCEKEALQLLYDLIIDGIVEPSERGDTK